MRGGAAAGAGRLVALGALALAAAALADPAAARALVRRAQALAAAAGPWAPLYYCLAHRCDSGERRGHEKWSPGVAGRI